METFVGLLLFAALFAAIVLWKKGLEKVGSVANQKVFMRKANTEGKDVVKRGLAIDLDVPPSQFLDAVVERMNLPTSAPALLPALYLRSRTEDGLQFASGTKIVDNFFAVLVANTMTDGRTTALYKLTQAKESGGIVVDHKYMRMLLEDISEAARSVDPTARISELGRAAA